MSLPDLPPMPPAPAGEPPFRQPRRWPVMWGWRWRLPLAAFFGIIALAARCAS